MNRYELHEKLHEKVDPVPCPPEAACREIYGKLIKECRSKSNYDNYYDRCTAEERLWTLIELFRDYPETVAALEAQLRVVLLFYLNGKV